MIAPIYYLHYDHFGFPRVGIWWMIRILVPATFDWSNNLRCTMFALLFPLDQTLMTTSIYYLVAHNTWADLGIPLCKVEQIKWKYVSSFNQRPILDEFNFTANKLTWDLRLRNSAVQIPWFESLSDVVDLKFECQPHGNQCCEKRKQVILDFTQLMMKCEVP